MTIPFPSHLNDYYCDEKKGSYGPQFLVANSYEASHIDNPIPQKEKDPGSFTLPCYINNVCFDNALADLEASRDKVDDLMPTIEESEVIDEPMIDIIKTRNNESFNEYLSFSDFDWKIHNDCAYNLRFSCMIVVENINGYRDQDMEDVIFKEPLCKASCMEARRIDGLITIHNGNDNVTYQMARSHPRSSLEKKSTKLVKYRSFGILCVL
nr:hypothetical protein [Tanacetum cinerariifolium]